MRFLSVRPSVICFVRGISISTNCRRDFILVSSCRYFTGVVPFVLENFLTNAPFPPKMGFQFFFQKSLFAAYLYEQIVGETSFQCHLVDNLMESCPLFLKIFWQMPPSPPKWGPKKLTIADFDETFQIYSRHEKKCLLVLKIFWQNAPFPPKRGFQFLFSVERISLEKIVLETYFWCHLVDNLVEPCFYSWKFFEKWSLPPQSGVSNIFTWVKLLKYWFYRNFYIWTKCFEW